MGSTWRRATGKPWPVTRGEALIAVAGVMQVILNFVDRDATSGRHLVFELRLRAGPTMNMTIDDGAMRVAEGRVARADCRISADPLGFLLPPRNERRSGGRWRRARCLRSDASPGSVFSSRTSDRGVARPAAHRWESALRHGQMSS